MARLKEVVVDCDVPSKMARFWSQVLDDYEILPYDDQEIARLAALGLTPETDTSVMLVGPGTRICFHLRTGPRPDRNRVHFDVAATDAAAEIARLQALGATFLRQGEGYTVLRDIEGNNFCVVAE